MFPSCGKQEEDFHNTTVTDSNGTITMVQYLMCLSDLDSISLIAIFDEWRFYGAEYPH